VVFWTSETVPRGRHLRGHRYDWYVTKPTRSTQPCIPPGSLIRVLQSCWLEKMRECHLCRSVIPCSTLVSVAVRLIVANCYTMFALRYFTIVFPSLSDRSFYQWLYFVKCSSKHCSKSTVLGWFRKASCGDHRSWKVSQQHSAVKDITCNWLRKLTGTLTA